VAGLVVVHQAPPTAKGFHFFTLEDEDGLIDVVVQPQVYARTRQIWRASPLLVVVGTVQQGEGVVNLLAHRVAACSYRGNEQVVR
jgi:error-prone DNA polymerase